MSGLTWRPSRRRTPVLADLDLTIGAGERVVLAGPSGAGKSTLLRAMAGLLLTASHGDLSGTALVDGIPAGQRPGDVALLLQEPTAGIVAESVGRDVAFGPENLRVPRDELWRLVHGALAETSFPYGVDHPTRALSGGESQRLALAGGLALGSRVLLLDEPTSMLDEPTAASVRQAVRSTVQQRGTTLVVVEHRIGPWLDFADRLVVLGPDGELIADGPPDRVLSAQGGALAALGVWTPDAPLPTSSSLDPDLVAPHDPVPGPVVTAERVAMSLTSRLPGRRRTVTQVLDGIDASMRAGRVLAVCGPSGAGKSTLVSVLAGLARPSSGEVLAAAALATRQGRQPWRWRSRDLAARLAWTPQVAEAGMVASSVRDEVLASGRAIGRDLRWLEPRAEGLIEAFGLSPLANVSPHHLSGGEQRRLMVAAALAHGPAAALFDEPTVGQDRLTWSVVVSALHGAAAAGAAVSLATHDTDAVARLSGDLLMLAPRVTGQP